MKTWLSDNWGEVIIVAVIAIGLLFIAVRPYPTIAAPATPDTECVLWADIKPWAITRCESWEDATVCYIATSGFLQCFRSD
jgi:hypothetical protein